MHHRFAHTHGWFGFRIMSGDDAAQSLCLLFPQFKLSLNSFKCQNKLNRHWLIQINGLVPIQNHRRLCSLPQVPSICPERVLHSRKHEGFVATLILLKRGSSGPSGGISHPSSSRHYICSMVSELSRRAAPVELDKFNPAEMRRACRIWRGVEWGQISH